MVRKSERNADQEMIQQVGWNIIIGIFQYEDLFRSFDSVKSYAVFDCLEHLEKVNWEKVKPTLYAIYLDLKKKDAGKKRKLNRKFFTSKTYRTFFHLSFAMEPMKKLFISSEIFDSICRKFLIIRM